MDDVVVARIGKAHGLKGEVTVQLHTDNPEERFVPGAVFATEPAASGPLTVRIARMHNGIQLLGFAETTDRTGAEALRGIKLVAAPDRADEADDGWYEEDLVGLAVVLTDGTAVGTVTALHMRPAQDLLVIEKVAGGTAYVPLVEEIVPEVDLEAGRVVIDPPTGLLDLEEH